MASAIVSQSVCSPVVPASPPRPHASVYEIITSQILAELERGEVPWRKPWQTLPPANLISKKPYRGINVFLLGFAGYGSQFWLTFNQAKQLGGNVRRGGKEFVGSDAFCLQAMAMSPDGLLDVSTTWLKVAEWSAYQIIATDDSSICLTSETIFDLGRKTVIALDVRKPEAQGLEGACNLIPDRQTYYLQDKVDYFAKKSISPTK